MANVSKNHKISPRNLEILNLFEAIEEVEKMIALHQDGGSDLMVRQYSQRKERFISELNELLSREMKLKLVKV